LLAATRGRRRKTTLFDGHRQGKLGMSRVRSRVDVGLQRKGAAFETHQHQKKAGVVKGTERRRKFRGLGRSTVEHRFVWALLSRGGRLAFVRQLASRPGLARWIARVGAVERDGLWRAHRGLLSAVCSTVTRSCREGPYV
jgi:hypothetical protein